MYSSFLFRFIVAKHKPESFSKFIESDGAAVDDVDGGDDVEDGEATCELLDVCVELKVLESISNCMISLHDSFPLCPPII
jgi:hypothetical protein